MASDFMGRCAAEPSPKSRSGQTRWAGISSYGGGTLFGHVPKKPFREKGLSRPAFEILLKGERGSLISKAKIDHQVPRLEFAGVRRPACIVIGEALFQVRRYADIVLLSLDRAFDQIDV